jgi:hypothetical protein
MFFPEKISHLSAACGCRMSGEYSCQFFNVDVMMAAFVDRLTGLEDGSAFTAAEMIMPITTAPTKAMACLAREEIFLFDM